MKKLVLMIVMIPFILNSCKKEEITNQNDNNSTKDSLSFPIITTKPVTNISWDTAVCGGVVSNDGGSDIKARGVCWGINPNPTMNDSLTVDDAGTGEFISVLRNLENNTRYFVRAYATNGDGTSYGLQVEFTTTKTTLPVVSTHNVKSIGMDSAICGGIIISDGNLEILKKGVCWSTSPNPSIDDSVTIDGSGIDDFESLVPNLKLNTKYYVRAYATNLIGTGYGEVVEFTTLNLRVGDNFQGGLIGYIFQEGDYLYNPDSLTGIIFDLNANELKKWGCQDIDISGTSSAVGYGKSNTNKILNGCSDKDNAAAFCANYSIGSYDDWFLPSLDEIKVFFKWANIPTKLYFWTSTQADHDYRMARAIQLDDPEKPVGDAKDRMIWICPARYFSVSK